MSISWEFPQLSLILALALQAAQAPLPTPPGASPTMQTVQEVAEPVELWQGLKTGMTPQEAVAVLSSVATVKKARVVNERKPLDPRRIDVSLTGEGYMIAGVPFQIGALFKVGRLHQALIRSGELCASAFPEAYNPIRAGMIKKYGPPFFEEKEIGELEVLESLGESSRLGASVMRFVGFRAGSVAALVSVEFNRQQRLARPYGMGKLARALWEFAESEQRQKIVACPGNSGLDRFTIGIVYMHANELDAMIKAANEATKKKAEDTSGKL